MSSFYSLMNASSYTWNNNTGSSSNGNIIWSYTPATPYKFFIFNLPNKNIPFMVFINGKAVSLGPIGTKSDCLLAPNKLVLKSDLFWGLTREIHIILQYKSKSYYYFVNANSFLKDKSNIINAKLTCKIKSK